MRALADPTGTQTRGPRSPPRPNRARPDRPACAALRELSIVCRADVQSVLSSDKASDRPASLVPAIVCRADVQSALETCPEPGCYIRLDVTRYSSVTVIQCYSSRVTAEPAAPGSDTDTAQCYSVTADTAVLQQHYSSKLIQCVTAQSVTAAAPKVHKHDVRGCGDGSMMLKGHVRF